MNQAIGILYDLKFEKCIKGNQNEGYDNTDPDLFAQLLAKSRVLVAYVDAFVLEHKADKFNDVRALEDYDKKRGDDRNDYYYCLCYATGLLNTILTECKWKKMPSKIIKQEGAMGGGSGY